LEHHGQPTVILAKTIKGYGLGAHFAGRNATHQMKKLSLDDLKQFRDEQRIPISDATLEADPYLPPYYHPGKDAPEIRYMAERRSRLGGALPSRRVVAKPLVLPGDKVYDVVRRGSGKQEVATTMAFVRLLRELIKDKEIGGRFVPVIPDEARTFGMDSMFPTQKIYNPHGQQYTSVDATLMLAYKESEQGQLLHEGINEAGSVGSFTAAGTSYATHGVPMIPVYVFYSMFGFQRTGDSIWAAADQMAAWLPGRAPPRAAPRSPARGCSTTTGTRCCWRRPTRPSSPTTRRSRSRSRTSCATACGACTAATTGS
jgi:pyruvate dehydrogenase E1 component